MDTRDQQRNAPVTQSDSAAARYCPPRPSALSPVVSLLRMVADGEGDLLSLLPASAYRVPIGPLGYSRRQIVVVNDPQLYRPILNDPGGIFPKNDLMVDALAPLVGDSMFISSGHRWRQQRRMIEPALSQLRVGQAFASMSAAIDDYEQRLCAQAASAQPLSLDVAMSHLTADIICRTVFSTSLDSNISRQVFESFKVFERSVAQVEIKRLIWDRAWQPAPQRPQVLDACATIRGCLGQLLDPHLNDPAAYNDICTSLMGAVDPQEGYRFTREELLDQLGVMFLAGHETTASVLIWVFFVLSQQPQLLQRVRAEVQQVVGNGPVLFEHIRQLSLVRNVFREALRLYPPITFIPRVANEDTRIGDYAVKRGAMVMISPWTIHRNESLWPDAHRFDPDRFDTTREQEQVAGAYLPFGLGPRVCAGAAFANTEAVLILTRLVRRFDLVPLAPQRVRPVARLTTRPREPIVCRVTLRGSAA